ncbi:hypothetical protein V2S85_26240 [Novosphingobium resinovorum]|nr:hypothetical protein [Novosphingobium resinovorum]
MIYAIGIFGLAQWVSRDKAGAGPKNSTDYFLASKNLPWWAIGASLIAANISAERIVGMSGSGCAIGLAIATYEWMAAAGAIVIAILTARPLAVVVSLATPARPDKDTISTGDVRYATSTGFNTGAIAVVLVLCVLYAVFW